MISIWTVLALVLMVALGGFISYFGDIQGSRWGKRRVRWLGMRPKRTAQVITALTGMGISALSIITLLLVSPTIRKVVIRGEQLITENRNLLARLNRQRIQFEEEIRQREADSRKLAQQQAAQLQTIHDLEQKRTDLAQQVVDKVARIKDLTARQIDLANQKIVLEARLNTDRQQIRKLTGWSKEVSDRNWVLTRNSDELHKTVEQLTSTRGQLVDAINQLKKDHEKLQEINAALKNDDDALDQANIQMAQANTQMVARNQELENYNASLKAKQAELEARNNRLVQGLVTTEQESAQENLTMRRGRVNFRSGEMIARRVIDSHMRPERVRAELNSLLDDANAIATIRSAGRGENGRAVRIATTRTVTLAGIEETNENDTLNSLVDSLSGRDAPALVMANVVNNSIVGEQVVLDVIASPVTQAFRRGDVVASVEVDGAQPMDSVLNSIVNFLEHDVHDAAIKAGLVPRVDPQTGVETLGNVGPQDLIPLTDRIRRMGGQVRVTALARKTVTSTDPLALDFKVTRVPAAE